MCRIAGIFSFQSGSLAADIVRMRDAMYRGGPDSAGYYLDADWPLALGHRRLALIDLSTAGQQPMTDLDGQIQLVFNGEIYNFQSLRHELKSFGHQFHTQTDTEVIVKAYLQWGLDCFGKFNGMFALALWDKRTNQLLLARDHAGIKPLYFSTNNNRLVFASEIRAFTALDANWPENPNWKIPFLTFGHLPEPFTTLQGVEPLPKGTVAIFQLPSCTYQKHIFKKFVFSSLICNEQDATAALKHSVEAAVERHLIADAPIGLFLSGGVDSSILTLLAHKHTPHQLKTLSIVFEDAQLSEEPFQKIIVQKTGAAHHSYLVTENEFSENLSDIIAAMDQPSTDGINSYFICKYAHQYGLTAVLSGLGADELFGGYPSFNRVQQMEQLKKLPDFVTGLARLVPNDKFKKILALQRKDALGDYLFNRGFFTTYQTADLLDCSPNEVHDCLNNIRKPEYAINEHAKNKVAASETDLYMQNQLLKDTDCMSMWHGLEVRVPFLDKEVMQVAYQIAPEIKFHPVQGKHLLVKAFKNILPEPIWNRPKQGFTFPFHNWMHQVFLTERTPKYRELAKKYMLGDLHWSRYWCYLLSKPGGTIRYYKKNIPTVLFANLTAFSLTGGIEKFNRCFLHALYLLELSGQIAANGISAYDTIANAAYLPIANYTCMASNRWQFIKKFIQDSKYYNVVVVGHINMALPALWIKWRYGKTKKVILVAHGVEVWSWPVTLVGKLLLKYCDQILAVSRFTQQQMMAKHGIAKEKIKIFHNTIDPFFHYPTHFEKPLYLHQRYQVQPNEHIIFTLTRLSSTEKYKGYDLVIDALPDILAIYPNTRYFIAGKPDEMEQQRICNLIDAKGLKDKVVLLGYIKEEEITDHYLLADVFIMPSRKEGFGIVFIEAMACGLPVIAGNQDGSVDALQNGALGSLINPQERAAIVASISEAFNKKETALGGEKQLLQQEVKNIFGFPLYMNRLSEVLQ